jgi:lysozyme
MNKQSIELIKCHEGLRLEPYKDSEGILTVGYGHNLEVPIDQNQANSYLRQDLANVVNDLEKYDWYYGLDDVRQAVVENMMFNLGAKRFAGFKKMIKAVKKGDYATAADEMVYSKWYRQVKKRAEDLVYMMDTGEWV